VREYLTSDRIATLPSVSRFHILPKPGHSLLARACLGVLLRLDYNMDRSKIPGFPLTLYAAKHWVDHAQFEDVSSDIRDGMDRLFDRHKPHLFVWFWLYDIEKKGIRYFHRPTHLDAVPLYYVGLCGFRDVAKSLLDAYPQDINARGGHYETPLHAAVVRGHLDVVLLLLERGADVESRGHLDQTALYMGSSRGDVEVMRALFNHGADPNAECHDNEHYDVVKSTPLLFASKNGRLEIARVLLENVADVNYKDNEGRSLLQIASRHPFNGLARLLLDQGANPSAPDHHGTTALHDASYHGRITVIVLLLEHSANVNFRNKSGRTPLHDAAECGHVEAAKLLLDHGADVNSQTGDRWTALHLAAYNGFVETGDLAAAWCGSLCPDQCGQNPFPVCIATKPRADREIVIRAHR